MQTKLSEAENRMANEIWAEYRAAKREIQTERAPRLLNDYARLSAENEMHALAKVESMEAWM